MGRYVDFAHSWYADTILYSVDCPNCGEKVSYRKQDVTRSGHIRCKKCTKLFRISR